MTVAVDPFVFNKLPKCSMVLEVRENEVHPVTGVQTTMLLVSWYQYGAKRKALFTLNGDYVEDDFSD